MEDGDYLPDVRVLLTNVIYQHFEISGQKVLGNNKKGDDYMSYGIKVEVWGDYALFTRPELKSERMSYEIITPSAARGLIESIYWHPAIKIVIDQIYLLPKKDESPLIDNATPIQFVTIRRNGVNSKVSASSIKEMMAGGDAPFISTKKDILQRSAVVIKDPHYVILAHFEVIATDEPPEASGKYKDIFQRRIEKGQFYSQPYFGCREFAAHFRPWVDDKIPAVDYSKDLGLMLFDMDYSNPKQIHPTFFHAELKHGMMQVSGKEIFS